MNFLVNWFIVLASLLAATLFFCLSAPHARHAPDIGRARRVASARLMTQAVLGFWTAALIVVRGILFAEGAEASQASFAALSLAALGLVSISAYWAARGLRLRRPRALFTR